jgi:hypothetical protein
MDINTRDRYLPAALLMQDTGGSFASAIGKAFIVADRNNMFTLLNAFPDLFERYATIAAEQDARRQQG